MLCFLFCVTYNMQSLTVIVQREILKQDRTVWLRRDNISTPGKPKKPLTWGSPVASLRFRLSRLSDAVLTSSRPRRAVPSLFHAGSWRPGGPAGNSTCRKLSCPRFHTSLTEGRVKAPNQNPGGTQHLPTRSQLSAKMAGPELLLDSNIRLWVVLPIVIITFFVGMIRHYVSILLQSDKKLTQEQVSDRSVPSPYPALTPGWPWSRKCKDYITLTEFSSRPYWYGRLTLAVICVSLLSVKWG